MSQSMTTLPSATGDGEEDDDGANKYQVKVDLLQTEVRELRNQYNSLRDTHRRLRTNIGDATNRHEGSETSDEEGASNDT